MSALDWRPDLIRRELIIKKFQKEDFQSAALFMYPLDPIAINFDVYPISLFLSYANRCHPQHRAIGLRKESQSHPAGCRFRLRHETIRARPGQRQSQPRLPPRMDRCRPFEFSSVNSLSTFFFLRFSQESANASNTFRDQVDRIFSPRRKSTCAISPANRNPSRLVSHWLPPIWARTATAIPTPFR